MAQGSFSISGSDVYTALTEYKNFMRVLNFEGENLANLVAERVFAKLAERLGRKEEDEP